MHDCSPTPGASGHASSHANAGAPPAVVYAIQEREVRGDPVNLPNGTGIRADNCAYTLEARPVPQAVCVTGASPHPLKADGFDGSEDGTGRGQPITIFQGRGSNIDLGQSVTGTPSENCDRASGGAPCVATAMRVRRLMPVECERLQGFPDHWTLATARNGRPVRQADGPRYKQLGNSMPVPVISWLGKRIQTELRHGS